MGLINLKLFNCRMPKRRVLIIFYLKNKGIFSKRLIYGKQIASFSNKKNNKYNFSIEKYNFSIEKYNILKIYIYINFTQ
jgi:hypothetical protein